MYKVGDKFEIEIAEVFNDDELREDRKLYRIMGFNSLVFDRVGLNKLKKAKDSQRAIEKAYADGKMDGYMQGRKEAEEEHKNNADEPIKTVKASELAVDTLVLCSNVSNRTACIRYFAGFFNGIPYTFVNGETSVDGDKSLVTWKHITLEDGTIVLAE